MTSMVERMAWAMALETRPASKWRHIPEITQQAYLNAALAALREMRDPTEVMLRAATTSAHVPAGYIIRAAIDAEIAAYEAGR